MNVAKTIFGVIILLFFSVGKINAQTNLLEINDLSNVNIDSYTDAQISELLKKASDVNMDEEEIYNIAKGKGLPDAELNKLKFRVENLNQSKSRASKKEEEVVADASRTYDSSAVSMENNYRELSVFGSQYFQKNSILFEPNLRIATPPSYILGPDDKIVLSVFGLSEKKYPLRVNEEGEIYIPNVGPIYVNGLSIEQATQKIKSKLASTIYHAINTGQTQIAISLTKIRSIRVAVIGEATKPGTYTVSSLTTLYNLLFLCGGPGSLGSFREIEIIRGNVVKRVADLYSFLVNGNQSDNILLEDGDVVRIPYYKNVVSIYGSVKRSATYELLEKETIGNLLQLCGGFTEKSFQSSISVERITDSGRCIIDVPKNQYNTFKLLNGDQIKVRKNQDKYVNRVSIQGSVIRPGSYELSQGLTLKELIEKAGGLSVDAYTKNTSIFRYQTNRIPTILNVDLDSVQMNQKIIVLQKDDSVTISSLFDFKDSMYIKVEGNVRNELKIKWRDGMSLQDAILMAGGVTTAGDSNKVEISSRVMNVNINEKNHIETDRKSVV